MATAGEVIDSALRLIGVMGVGETTPAAESQHGLTALNELLASFSAAGIVFGRQQLTSSITVGQGSVTFGTGGNVTTRIQGLRFVGVTLNGVDYQIRRIGIHEYEDFANKTVQGLPEYAYLDNGYPLSTLYLYPRPDQTMTLFIDALTPINLATLTTTINVPPEMVRAVRYHLAIDLATEYGRTIPAEIAVTADNALERARMANHNQPVAQFDMLLGGGKPFSITTG